MSRSLVIAERAQTESSKHLLSYVRRGERQEDLCFALWRPSTGLNRRTAIVYEVVLPENDERNLHGNASFEPRYLARSLRLAVERNSGLAFMHSHTGPGWQDTSPTDVQAERDVIAYPAGATGLPLVGMTIGSDGVWSARFWESSGAKMKQQWCESVRVPGQQTYALHFNDNLLKPQPRREVLRRTFDTWGTPAQNDISRMRIGIVGLGSVGCIVAEALARIGVSQMTLIDPDHVEEHNLDRLLYGSEKDIGRPKVEMAAGFIKRHATTQAITVDSHQLSIQDRLAYNSALDCDLLFSCVDRPVARDVLNFIANAHLIPVIDGGVAVETDQRNGGFFSAHWRAHIITPYHQCMRCNRQYNTGMVSAELDGSLDDPSYVSALEAEQRSGNQNVFPFALGAAGMEVNLMLRYLLAREWWPLVKQQEYQFLIGTTRVTNGRCQRHCAFLPRHALGDATAPSYLTTDNYASESNKTSGIARIIGALRRRLFRRT